MCNNDKKVYKYSTGYPENKVLL